MLSASGKLERVSTISELPVIRPDPDPASPVRERRHLGSPIRLIVSGDATQQLVEAQAERMGDRN